MKNTLNYKGFTARVEFDSDDNLFFGRVLGLQGIIGFHGETVSEMTSDFHNAIDHYLEVCQQHGEKPQKACSISIRAQELVKLKGKEAMQSEIERQRLIEDEKDPEEKAINDALRSPQIRQKLDKLAHLLEEKGL